MITPNLPQDITAIQGPRIHRTEVDGKLFEIFQDRGPRNLGYIGCCDGKPSVIGAQVHSVLSGLSRKHLGQLPAGELVDFAAAARTLRERRAGGV